MEAFEAWWDDVMGDRMLRSKYLAKKAWTAALAHHAKEREAATELAAASKGLLDSIYARYPGEKLRCPHMRRLAKALICFERLRKKR